MTNLSGRTVLVTGATGFIGGRLVEKLILDEGAHVKVLLRNFARAPRIARFALDMIPGDVTDPAAVRRAATGCDVIVHCAFGNSGTPQQQRATTVQGTEIVARAAMDLGIRRLVYLSTISVYGLPGDGDLDETAPRRTCGDHYSDMKLEAERLVLAHHERHGLPVTVLQPTIVYGPFSGPWTIGPLSLLKQERVVLVDGGSGMCNAVYVDDVVDAIILAAVRDEGVGQSFLISGDRPVTWRQFFGAYEQMLGQPSTVALSAADIRALHRERRKARGTVRQVLRVLRREEQLRSRLLQLPALGVPYRLMSAALPDRVRVTIADRLFPRVPTPAEPARRERPIALPGAYQTQFFQARTRVRIDKARASLGYKPRVSFEEGMRLTNQWAAWANLL